MNSSRTGFGQMISNRRAPISKTVVAWEDRKKCVGISTMGMLIYLTVIPSCYFDWDEYEYVTPCNPLSPNTTCPSQQMRCAPQKDGEPVCEGPVSKSNQNGYCHDNSDCGSIELCLSPHHLLSTICVTLCRDDDDCPATYTCKPGFGIHVRGEEWGGCFAYPPPEWHCDDIYYAGTVGGKNTQCDCGCGVFDPDCPDTDPTSCEECPREYTIQEGGCVPEGWNCDNHYWNDGYCDCGCGVLDAEDCFGQDRKYCDNCPGDSCGEKFDGGCRDFDPIRPHDNYECKDVPTGWVCDLKSYEDGAVCDCGCGTVDADCETARSSDCESCPIDSCGYDAGCDVTLFVASDNSQCNAKTE